MSAEAVFNKYKNICEKNMLRVRILVVLMKHIKFHLCFSSFSFLGTVLHTHLLDLRQKIFVFFFRIPPKEGRILYTSA